jgi:DNA ligase-1
MNCIESLDRKYTSRPSPPFPANQCPEGMIKKGNDGNLWIIKKASNGINRWVKYKSSPQQKILNPVIIKLDKSSSQQKILSPVIIKLDKPLIQLNKQQIQQQIYDINKGVMEYSQLRPRQVQLNKEKLLNRFVDNYFVSVKYDGWQAVWDGKNTLMTKTGKNIFPFPDSWKSFLPKVPIAGELIIIGKQAANVASLKKKDCPDWKNARLMVFDLLNTKEPFHKRIETLKKIISSSSSSPIQLVEQHLVTSVDMLYDFYKNILKKKGEGVVLTEKNSLYIPNIRSKQRVKLKGRQDSEGKIISYNLKDGKLSSLVIELKNGSHFNLGIGFKNKERQNYKQLLPIGKYAKYSYRELTDNHKPKQARFIQLRQDIY